MRTKLYVFPEILWDKLGSPSPADPTCLMILSRTRRTPWLHPRETSRDEETSRREEGSSGHRLFLSRRGVCKPQRYGVVCTPRARSHHTEQHQAHSMNSTSLWSFPSVQDETRDSILASCLTPVIFLTSPPSSPEHRPLTLCHSSTRTEHSVVRRETKAQNPAADTFPCTNLIHFFPEFPVFFSLSAFQR